MPAYVIYVRKSTESEDRQVLSIDSQITELQRLARQRGLTVTEVLTEARSAKAPGKRPVFNDLIDRIYCGRIQGILCWKLDRLARNPVDGGAVIWALKQHDLEIVTPTQAFRQSDDNTILMYIEFGMAQKYIDDLSRNVKRGRRAKAELGWYPGIPPQGYLNNPLKNRGADAIIDDADRSALVRRMWDLILTGIYSPPRILEIATRDWGYRTRQGQPLVRSAIYKILSNPFYCGMFEFPKGSGQWYQGKHRPVITREEYDRAQVILGTRGRPRPQSYTFPLRGLLRCGGCSGAVTVSVFTSMGPPFFTSMPPLI